MSQATKLFALFGAMILLWITLQQFPPVRTVLTDKQLHARGVLAPGGFIAFSIDPGIRAVDGRFDAEIILEPSLSEEQRPQGVVWPSRRIEKRGFWGSTIEADKRFVTSSVTMRAILPIPASKTLSGETVQVRVLAIIDYPELEGGTTFSEQRTDLDRTVNVELGGRLGLGGRVSAWIKRPGLGTWLRVIYLACTAFVLVAAIRIRRRSPPMAESLADRAAAAFNDADYERTVSLSDEALRYAPRLTRAWYNKGTALLRLGRNEEALACYEKALKQNPQHTNSWFNKGLALEQLARLPEAARCFEHILLLQPDDADARRWLEDKRAREVQGTRLAD